MPASPGVVLGVTSALIGLVQEGLLERAFHDGLFPALQFRAEALYEEWPEHAGQVRVMTRPGLLPAITRAIQPGQDPIPQAVSYEQWVAELAQYTGTIDTHMPTSVVAAQNIFLRNIKQLGLQAGQSLNRVPRNALFVAYLSGQTNLITVANPGDTTLRVAAINGFTDVVLPNVSPRPQPVSPATPLAAKINATIAINIVNAIPDNPDDPKGPGTLYLAAPLGAGAVVRSAVVSSAAPFVLRSGGGISVDAIGAGDVFTLQDAINAVNRLRKNNVRPHEDGYYHAHIAPDVQAQVFADPAFQRLNTALPDGTRYQQGFIGTISGIMFFMNNEAPDVTNSGALTATGALSVYAEDIGAEVVNKDGIKIGRTIITGQGALYEMTLGSSSLVTEAGLTGKMGDFAISNNGIAVQTERIDLILRAPLNRLQDQVAATWQIKTSFPVPSDVTSGTGGERYKRAVVIESALPS